MELLSFNLMLNAFFGMHVSHTYINITTRGQTFFLNWEGKPVVSTICTCGTQRPRTPHYFSVFSHFHLKVHCGTLLCGYYASLLFFIYQ